MNGIVTSVQNQVTATIASSGSMVEIHALNIDPQTNSDTLDGGSWNETLPATQPLAAAEQGAGAAALPVSGTPSAATGFKLGEYLTNSTPTPGGIVSVLESWASERERWEGAELAASHQRLYAILSQCYEFYLTMKSNTTAEAVRKQLAAGLDAFIKQRGLKTLGKTHDMVKVVKAIFGEDRRRVSAYATALRAALVAGADVQAKSDHVPAEQLATWIASKGGVEELRLGSKNGGLTAKDRADAAKAAIDVAPPLLTFKPDAKSMPFSTDDADKKLVLLVTYRPTGEIEVHAVVKHDSVVNAALAAYHADHKDEFSGKAAAAQASATAVAHALGA